MNFKMRAETHYYQPKKVRKTTCLNPCAFISPPASFQTLQFSIGKPETALSELELYSTHFLGVVKNFIIQS